MGDQVSCCNSRDQLNNTNNSPGLLHNNLPLTIENQKGENKVMPSFAPISRNIEQLLERAKNSKYFKTNDKFATRKQTIIYGKNTQYALYEGDVVDNFAQGYGTVRFPNGSVFQGTFNRGEPNNGVYIFNGSCYYVGDIQAYQASGEGIYQNIENGYFYQGQWKKNLQHGRGVQKYSNKDQYAGSFMCGSKFGQGQYKFSDGTHYKGSFYNGHSDGFGKLVLSNGDIYEGEWKLGQMHGKGIYKWKNGQKYQGEYANGMRQNKGKYYFSGGAQYQGQWLNGQQNGQGSIKQGYDEVFGEWRQGQKIS